MAGFEKGGLRLIAPPRRSPEMADDGVPRQRATAARPLFRFAVQGGWRVLFQGAGDRRTRPTVEAKNPDRTCAVSRSDQFPPKKNKQRHADDDCADNDPEGILHGPTMPFQRRVFQCAWRTQKMTPTPYARQKKAPADRPGLGRENWASARSVARDHRSAEPVVEARGEQVDILLDLIGAAEHPERVKADVL